MTGSLGPAFCKWVVATWAFAGGTREGATDLAQLGPLRLPAGLHAAYHHPNPTLSLLERQRGGRLPALLKGVAHLGSVLLPGSVGTQSLFPP